MKNKSHNKKRNVGIIYEQLLAYAAKALVESDKKAAAKAQSLIRRFFSDDTELYKEHRLFRAIIKPEIKDGSLATKILGEAKRAARSHNVPRLDREKSRLIKEINYSFGKDFYKQPISNYTDYATVQTMLNDWRSTHAPIDRLTFFESKVHDILMTQEKEPQTKDMYDKQVDNLVVKVMTEKYNTKYGNKLGDVQQLLLKEYIFSEKGDSTGFKKILNKIKETVLKDLEIFETECENNHVAGKITEVKDDIRTLDINTLDDQIMARFLTLCDLSDELRRTK